MGTNYYLKSNVCHHCGRGDDPKHIGKSSAGWCFSLHVYPEEGIKDLPDWETYFKKLGNKIEDEYGRGATPEEMLEVIMKRGHASGLEQERKVPYGYSSWDNFYERNHAVPGPNNLLRHKIDNRFCIGHGEGTWDLLIGEFS